MLENMKTISHLWKISGSYLTLSKPLCRKALQITFPPIQLQAAIVRLTSTASNSKVEEVYYGALTPQIFNVKVFSLATSVTGVISQPILYHQVSSIGSLPLVVGIATFLGFFTFVTPLLLHFISRKYVTHINYDPNEDSYTAYIMTFFLRKKGISFKPNDVEIPKIPGMFTSFNIRGRPVFVDPSLFREPMHYARIMGFDKPVDYKLSNLSEQITVDSKKNDPSD